MATALKRMENEEQTKKTDVRKAPALASMEVAEADIPNDGFSQQSSQGEKAAMELLPSVILQMERNLLVI